MGFPGGSLEGLFAYWSRSDVSRLVFDVQPIAPVVIHVAPP